VTWKESLSFADVKKVKIFLSEFNRRYELDFDPRPKSYRDKINQAKRQNAKLQKRIHVLMQIWSPEGLAPT
jgi:hypothetical protein